MTISQPLNSHTTLFLLSLLLLASGCLFGDDDEPILPVEVTDPCSIVHETYPDVREDSCSWVLNVMRNYAPPTVLPPATDTGGQLLAARILTDTGEVIFVAGGVPQQDWAFGTYCDWWRTRDTDNDGDVLIGGNYCRRPPIDSREINFSMWINYFGQLYLPDNGPIALLSYRDQNEPEVVYVATSSDKITITNSVFDESSRMVSGEFSAQMHNRDDTTDIVTVVDGRFDVRY